MEGIQPYKLHQVRSQRRKEREGPNNAGSPCRGRIAKRGWACHAVLLKSVALET